MSHHYFIGIPLSSHLYDYAQDVIQRHQLSSVYRVVPHLEDLHITLSFIGPIKEEQLPTLIKELSEVSLRHQSLKLAINGTSYFGSPKHPRVVYLSMDKNNQLHNLQKEIAQKIATFFHTEIPTKPYIPHVTVAKKLKDDQTFSFNNETRLPIEFSASSFSLFRIHPRQTPKYEAIEDFNLSTSD